MSNRLSQNLYQSLASIERVSELKALSLKQKPAIIKGTLIAAFSIIDNKLKQSQGEAFK